ncbi:MAG TPA: diguanylate cyclase [Herpetosiphonaceae bacterium]|nr:diguanylate cyclase [Herpetosiphonaceae bacterium]
MELRHYLRMLGRGWWIISLAALSAMILALAKAYVTPPEYRTSARLVLQPNFGQIQSGQEIYAQASLQNRTTITTVAEVLGSGSRFKETGAALNLPPGEIFHYKNTAVTIPEANVVELFVDGPNAETTSLLANSLAQRIIDENAQTNTIYRLSILDAAIPPIAPEKPKPLRDAVLALILGAVAGAVLAIGQEQLRLPLEAYRRRKITDAVSAAYTRRYFDEVAKETLQRVETVSLGLVYLDGLQDTIETLPPAVTQRVLRQVRTILRNELRGNDVIGRWDTTTLSVLLPDTPESAASRTLDRILAALSQPIETGLDNETLHLTPYAGGATRHDNITYAQLADEAQAALSRSYRNGEKNVLFAAEAQTV